MSLSAERGSIARSASGGLARFSAGLFLALAACAKTDERWLSELADPDPFVRALAAIALSEQAPSQASAAVPVLLETVDRAELGLQPQARRALVKVGPRAVEVLRRNLEQDEFMTTDRRQAILDALEAAGAR